MDWCVFGHFFTSFLSTYQVLPLNYSRAFAARFLGSADDKYLIFMRMLLLNSLRPALAWPLLSDRRRHRIKELAGLASNLQSPPGDKKALLNRMGEEVRTSHHWRDRVR